MRKPGRDEPLGTHLPDAILAAPPLARLPFEVAESLPDRGVVSRTRRRRDVRVAERPEQTHALRRLERQIERRHPALAHDAAQLAAAGRVTAAKKRLQPILVDRTKSAEAAGTGPEPDTALLRLTRVVILAPLADLLEVVPLPLVPGEHASDRQHTSKSREPGIHPRVDANLCAVRAVRVVGPASELGLGRWPGRDQGAE
jgi:hypothetical protein